MDFSQSMTTTTALGISTCITPTSAHQRVPPRLPGNPRRLTGAANTRPGDGKGTTATGATTSRPEGGDNLHRLSRDDRMQRQGLARHRMPRRVHLDLDSPATTLQRTDRRSPHCPRPLPPRHHQGTTLPNAEPPARQTRIRPKMAQNWAGRALPGPAPQRRTTANGRTAVSSTTVSRGITIDGRQ